MLKEPVLLVRASDSRRNELNEYEVKRTNLAQNGGSRRGGSISGGQDAFLFSNILKPTVAHQCTKIGSSVLGLVGIHSVTNPGLREIHKK